MKPYSSEFREKIVKIYEQGDTWIRKVAARFDISKGFVQKFSNKKNERRVMVNLKNFLVSLPTVLNSRTTELTRMVEKYPDSTLSE